MVRQTWGGNTLDVIYDNNSKPCELKYNGTLYYYVLNLQGDVIAIVSENGTCVATYTYDAWGSVISQSGTLAAVNPIRYRGYYYDSETGLYYLGSRYYDPAVKRFINADNVANIGVNGEFISNNLFAYCLNNPVNRTDTDGNWSTLATIGAVVGVTLCAAAITVLTCGVGTATLAGAMAVGAAKGALIGAAVGTGVGAGVGYATTGTVKGAATGAAIGFGTGAAIGAAVGGSIAGAKFGTFSSKAKLAEHYAKHGSEFRGMYSNAKQYAKGAKYVIKTGKYIPEMNGYIRFIGTQGRANYAFVGMKSGGRISTYGVRSVASLIAKGVSMFTS